MKLPFYITLTILSLVVVRAAAAPISAHDNIDIPLDSQSNDLRPRSLAAQVAKNVLQTQKQLARQVLKNNAKKAANKELVKSKLPPIGRSQTAVHTPVIPQEHKRAKAETAPKLDNKSLSKTSANTPGLSIAEQVKQLNKARKETSTAVPSQVIGQEHKEAKTKPAPKLENKSPSKTSIKGRPSKAERAEVKEVFANARKEMSTFKDLPSRDDKYIVGKSESTGRDVRAAIFNSIVHRNYPIGKNKNNQQPKTFHNRPYPKNHPDKSLAGKKMLPPGKYKEYPVKSTPLGWLGTSKTGIMRVITSKQGEDRKFAVVGHDPARGPNPNEHYLAEKVTAPAKP